MSISNANTDNHIIIVHSVKLLKVFFTMAAISVVSLNCHGFNVGIAQYLHRVASNADLILLQETWLSDTTCQKLTSAFTDFTVYHSSAMEDKIINYWL